MMLKITKIDILQGDFSKTFDIYQKSMKGFSEDYIGNDMTKKESIKVDSKLYKETYSITPKSCEILIDDEKLESFLEDIYEIFNIHRPEDFYGHSLSISNIIRIWYIEIKNNTLSFEQEHDVQSACYMVDVTGFRLAELSEPLENKCSD